MSKRASLARVGMAFLCAFSAGAAWLIWGPNTGHLWLDGLLADLVATGVVFLASRIHKNATSSTECLDSSHDRRGTSTGDCETVTHSGDTMRMFAVISHG